MLPLESLTWTSRADVCAQLLDLLANHPPEPADRHLREQAARLTCRLAGPEHAPSLTRLLGSPGESWQARLGVLERLHALGVAPPGAADALLREGVALVSNQSLWPRPECMLPRLLELDPGEAEVEAALSALDPSARMRLLGHEVLPAALRDRLVARYRAGDWRAVEPEWGGANLVADLLDLPETGEVLARWAAAPELRDAALERLEPEAVEVFARGRPEVAALAVERLALPLSVLVIELGESELLRRLERLVRRVSLSCQLPPQVAPPPPGVRRAAQLLARWPVARPLLWRLLCDLGLHPLARKDLLVELWYQERDAARRWALAALPHSENSPLLGEVAHLVALQSEEADAPLLAALLGGGVGRRVQLQALRAFEHLDLLPPAEALSAALASDSLRIRLHARAALVRVGDEASRSALFAWADRGEHAAVRAEAAMALGRAGIRTIGALHPALRPPGPEDHASYGLAMGLAMIGTDSARTSLLRTGWFGLLARSVNGRGVLSWPEAYADSVWAQVEPDWR